MVQQSEVIQQPEPQNYQIPDSEIRLAAMNLAQMFEIIINKDDLLIGKKAELVDAAIPFNNAISRKHCRIKKFNGLYYVIDEGSANGTFVNGAKLNPGTPCLINRGDIVRMANMDFKVL